MSQAASHPALIQLSDEIDSIGQRLRLYRIVRGAVLWIAFAVIATAIAALVAHLAREGRVTTITSVSWMGWLIASFIFWIGRPVLTRPKALAVARLVEKRVDGLHNGLTNSLLLGEAGDLQSSP